MKKFELALILAALVFATSALPTARAEQPSNEAMKASEAALKTYVDKANAWNESYGGFHSPEFSQTGIGLGAGLGNTTASGNAVNGAAAFNSRIFKESSMGRPEYFTLDSASTVRSEILRVATNVARSEAWERYNKDNKDNKRGTMTNNEVDIEIQRDVNLATQAVERALEARLKAYQESYAQAEKDYNAHPKERPLYLFEGSATYNMIGKAQTGGAFTGITGSARAGLGFTFKNYGKNGCDIYFLGTGNASASGYYRLEDANAARVAVGIEQGILCQIANTVTIMGSPSVQAGKFAHSSAANGVAAKTDWLNYSARVRAIIDGKLYVAAEAVLHPSMKKSADPGAHWKASETSVTLDYALPNSSWIAGADLKSVRFNDENAATTGMHSIRDDSLMLRAIRAF